MKTLTYGSLFSGIEGASVAWQPLGWRCAWVAEIDPFASALLAHRYPDVPNLGDVERIDAGTVEPVDLVVFGSPCQSFSVAGKRLGLDDARGNLALLALGLVARLRPRWLVFENVPGLFSSFSGSEQEERQVREGEIGAFADGAEDRDFAAFLTRVRECGYLGCWRVYDAQFTGVPQRRRRIFFVGHLGDWRPAAAVLLEPESLRGDPAPSRQAGQGAARPVASCAPGGSGYRNDADTADSLIAFSAKDDGGDQGATSPTLRAGMHNRSNANAGVMPAIAVAKALSAKHNMALREDADTLVATDLRNGAVGDVAMSLQGGGMGEDRGLCINAVPHALTASSLRTGGAPAGHSFRGDGSDNLIGVPVESDVADPISANEAKTWTHEGTTFRTHNLVYDRPAPLAFGGSNCSGPIEVTTAMRAKGGVGHMDFDSETFVTHALDSHSRGTATEDGTGRGVPLVAAYGISSDAVDRSGEDGSAAERAGLGIVADAMPALRARPNNAVAYGIRSDAGRDGSALTPSPDAEGRIRLRDPGFNLYEETAPTIDGGAAHAVAYDVTGTPATTGARATDVHVALRSRAPGASEGSTTTVVAHAFKASHYTRDKDGAPSEIVPPLSADADKGDQDMLVFESRLARNGRGAPDTVVPPLKAQSGQSGKGDAAPLLAAMSVRRLTPRECERLQGFSDDYTLIPYRGQLAADGPRYRAIGNSFAVPVVRYIGQRIAMFEAGRK